MKVCHHNFISSEDCIFAPSTWISKMGRVYKGICGRKVKKRMEKMRIAARAAKAARASSESSGGLGSAEAGEANAGDDFSSGGGVNGIEVFT